MNKKEQKAYTDSIKARLQERGIKIGFLLKQVGLSRSHWQFIRKGERPLTEVNRLKIEEFLNN